MKKQATVLCTAMFALTMNAEVYAQTRGANYNPPSGRSTSAPSSSSSSSSSSSRSTPAPSSSSSSSSSSPSRGSNYNPPSSSSSSSSTPRTTSTPAPSQPTRTAPAPSSSSSSTPTRSTPVPSPSSSSSSSSTPSRGSNYNPPSSSSSSSSTPRTTSTPAPSQPTRTAPSPSSISSSTPSRGSNYNPPSSSSSSSSTASRPSPSNNQSTPSSTGPRYNPNPGSVSQPSRGNNIPTNNTPVVRGPRYNPNPNASSYYSVPAHQQGRVEINRVYVHAPYRVTYSTVRYSTNYDYYRSVNSHYIYRSWLQEPVIFTYNNGYWMIDSYPYYVHRGFRYRYHPVEMCNYELVDSSGYSVNRSYGSRPCSVSYDICANERDNLNRNLYSDRYFCAENVGYQYASSNDNDYYGYANTIDDSQEYQIENFLNGKSFIDLFYAGRDYSVGQCSIQSSGYSYVVRVNNDIYPLTDGSVNSSPYAAEQIGCNVGSEAENAGCILKAAVQEGYCL